MRKIGIYLGRFQPLHIGHEKTLNTLISDFGYYNSYILIGSAHILNNRNIFTFNERTQMIKNVFNEFIDTHISYIDDINDDALWIYELLKIIKTFDASICFENVTFYAGSMLDVDFFNINIDSRKFKIKMNDRNNLKISGTDIRFAINNNDIEYIKKYTNEKNYSIILPKLRGHVCEIQ